MKQSIHESPAATPPTAESLTAGASDAQSEVQEYLYTSQVRRRLFPRAALVGLIAGIVAVAFRMALSSGEQFRSQMLSWAHTIPYVGWLFPILFGAIGAALAVALVRRFSPEAAGSGIPHLEAVLRRYRTMNAKAILPVKFLGGILALGSGLALGREGPTVQMGAATADLLSGVMRLPLRDRMTLMAAGAGAGLAAAFNAPLAGLAFVLEEIQRDFRPIVFGAAFVAAAVADIVARFASGPSPVLTVPSYPIQSLAALPIFLILGVIAGVLGVFFNRALLLGLNLFQSIPTRFAIAAAGVVGAVIGCIGWFLPDAIGGSHSLLDSVLHHQVMRSLILLWFLLRFFLTISSYSTGAPGGIFAPLLILGALIGSGVGDLAHQFAPGILPDPGVCAVVGMAAYFTAIVRAPLTGIVLILEMTGNYNQMLPVIVACFGAYAVAEGMRNHPIYEALLERDLIRSGVTHPHQGNHIREFTVQPGSAFDGRAVRDLGLPPGCILLRYQDDRGEFVPNGDTVLQGDMRITAVISPQSTDAVEILRRGCAGRNSEVSTHHAS